MHKLNIVAVGSNELTAKEIQQMLKEILGDFFTIHTATTGSIKNANQTHSLYVLQLKEHLSKNIFHLSNCLFGSYILQRPFS